MNNGTLLDIEDLHSQETIMEIMTLARRPNPLKVLAGRTVGAIFEKPSNRTRNSTEAAVFALGGQTVTLFDAEVGIDTRESAEDIARTLGCYHRVVMARVFRHEVLVRMAEALSDTPVPVVNLLSDLAHPMQALADILTIWEHFGSLSDIPIAYVGDANNVAKSLAKAVAMLGGTISIISPGGYELSEEERSEISGLGGRVVVGDDPKLGVKGARVIYGDVWTSMGQESEYAERLKRFEGFQINDELLSHCESDAIVLHCLPAHRGEEITASVLEGPQSVVWAQAKNRMRAMMGYLQYVGVRGEWL